MDGACRGARQRRCVTEIPCILLLSPQSPVLSSCKANSAASSNLPEAPTNTRRGKPVAHWAVLLFRGLFFFLFLDLPQRHDQTAGRPGAEYSRVPQSRVQATVVRRLLEISGGTHAGKSIISPCARMRLSLFSFAPIRGIIIVSYKISTCHSPMNAGSKNKTQNKNQKPHKLQKLENPPRIHTKKARVMAKIK